MGLWMHGWAGDGAVQVPGRQPNTLLISFTRTQYDEPKDLFVNGDLYGTTWYYGIGVVCLTPGSRETIVTNIAGAGAGYSLELLQLDRGDGKAPWQPGVHLFTVSIYAYMDGGKTSAFATAVIQPATVQQLHFKTAAQAARWDAMRDRLLGEAQERRSGARGRGSRSPGDDAALRRPDAGRSPTSAPGTGPRSRRRSKGPG
jgi:hypothetical protein